MARPIRSPSSKWIPPLGRHDLPQGQQPGGALHHHAQDQLPPRAPVAPIQTRTRPALVYLLLQTVQERRKARAPPESHGHLHRFHLPLKALQDSWLSVSLRPLPSRVFWKLEATALTLPARRCGAMLWPSATSRVDRLTSIPRTICRQVRRLRRSTRGLSPLWSAACSKRCRSAAKRVRPRRVTVISMACTSHCDPCKIRVSPFPSYLTIHTFSGFWRL